MTNGNEPQIGGQVHTDMRIQNAPMLSGAHASVIMSGWDHNRQLHTLYTAMSDEQQIDFRFAALTQGLWYTHKIRHLLAENVLYREILRAIRDWAMHPTSEGYSRLSRQITNMVPNQFSAILPAYRWMYVTTESQQEAIDTVFYYIVRSIYGWHVGISSAYPAQKTIQIVRFVTAIFRPGDRNLVAREVNTARCWQIAAAHAILNEQSISPLE